MDKIPSFTINHEKLLRGVYVSREDHTPGGEVLTTFDIRLTEPNRQPSLSPETMHTLEHLGATYLRNEPSWKDQVVYWGPMGCCTGFYLILQGERKPSEILPLMKEMFLYMSEYPSNEDIPGATPRDCGNYLFNDLEGAKSSAGKFLEEVLERIGPENMVYPE